MQVHLLKAEIQSLEEAKGGDCRGGAEASYVAAITSARDSGFVHEQGLACELAGFHHKRFGNHKRAQDYFSQAQQCYTVWGSQLKVGSMARQLEKQYLRSMTG